MSEKRFTRPFSKTSSRAKSWFVLIATILCLPSAYGWEIDFSKRQVEFNRVTDQSRSPASTKKGLGEFTRELVLKKVETLVEPVQEIVILNTEVGFVPSVVRMRKNAAYRIFVVNTHPREKNLSFLMDAFSESYGTVFGEPKSFTVTPKVDGVFSYQCPETGSQGRLVVVPDGPIEGPQRKMASE